MTEFNLHGLYDLIMKEPSPYPNAFDNPSSTKLSPPTLKDCSNDDSGKVFIPKHVFDEIILKYEVTEEPIHHQEKNYAYASCEEDDRDNYAFTSDEEGYEC